MNNQTTKWNFLRRRWAAYADWANMVRKTQAADRIRALVKAAEMGDKTAQQAIANVLAPETAPQGDEPGGES